MDTAWDRLMEEYRRRYAEPLDDRPAPEMDGAAALRLHGDSTSEVPVATRVVDVMAPFRNVPPPVIPELLCPCGKVLVSACDGKCVEACKMKFRYSSPSFSPYPPMRVGP